MDGGEAMSSTFWVWFGIGIYVVIGVVIAILARRRMGAGVSDFFIANRSIGGFVSCMTYSATTYSAFMMIGLVGLVYTTGIGAIGFELTYLAGIFMLIFFLPRFWLVGHKYGYISPAELLTDRYQSRAVGATAAILALVFLVPYGAVQMMGVGYLVSGISGGAIPVLAGILVAFACAIAWSRIAGMRSVAWTDALQALVMIVTCIVLLGIVVHHFGGFGSFFSKVNSTIPGQLTVPTAKGAWSLNMFIGMTLPWLFFCISNPQVSQRLFIPKSVTAMKQMLGGFLVFGLIYTVICTLFGLSGALLFPGLAAGDMAMPTLLTQSFIPMAVVIIILVGILAAAISTIDSILLSLSSMWARDVHKGLINTKATEARQLSIGQNWVIPIMAVIALVFAWWASGETGLAFMIAPLSSAASAGLLMAVPAIFGAFFWKRGTKLGAVVSMIVGAIVVIVFQVTGLKPLGWWPGVWGAIVCVILFFAVSAATKPPLEKAEEFMGYLKEKLAEGKFI
jgi:SSS family solute:Na+ symporter